jgi:hypothetical protein
MSIATLTPVTSSNIDAIGHNLATKVMTVRFNGGTIYDYQNVTAAKFDEILNAKSVGSALNKLVKSNPSEHPFTKVN